MSALPGTTGRRRIYLLRHGHVDYFGEAVRRLGNTEQVPLTETGRAQAAATGEALAHIRFDRALCSGLPRTEETARIVLKQQQEKAPQLQVDPDLKEIRGDRAQITSRRELSARLAFHFEAAAQPGATMLEGGEAFKDAYGRSIAAVEKLLFAPDWHTALVVAHEGINRLVLGWATGNGLSAVQAFEQDLACVNILDFDLVTALTGEGTQIERKLIKAVNLTPYNWTKHGMNLTSFEAIFEPV